MNEILSLILFFLIVVSVYFDYKYRKIPNNVTIPCFVLGVILNGVHTGLSGVLFAIIGAATGILIFIIPFAMGGMGAGDVKMLGAIGALMGTLFVFNTALIAAISGGVIAFVYLIYKLGFLGTIKKLFGPLFFRLFHYAYVRTGKAWFGKTSIKLNPSNNARLSYYIPYAIPISIGAVLAYFEFLM